MKKFNTKKNITITTYNQNDIDILVEKFTKNNENEQCRHFLDSLRSFNKKSKDLITLEEASGVVEILVKKNKKNKTNLYKNYNGNPLGININEVTLYFEDPVLSLKSAFKAFNKDFNFKKDFFSFSEDL